MKKIIYTLLILTAIVVNTGCSDWLELYPTNEQVTDAFWKSKEDVEAVVASGYSYMRTCSQTYMLWGELRGASVFSIANPERGDLQNFRMQPDRSLCRWSSFYNVINMANSVLKYAPQVQAIDETYTEPAMKSHQTEAYFMRAWAFFTLVRNFRDIPLIIEPYVDDEESFDIAKSPENDVIAQIKKDLETAIASGAGKEFYDSDAWNASKGRVTKYALYALLAEVCLWSGDYDGCIINANTLIESQDPRRPAFMSMPEQWVTLFYPGNSNESIFEINWDKNTYNQTSGTPSGFFQNSSSSDLQFTPEMGKRLVEEEISIQLAGKISVRDQLGSFVMVGEDVESASFCVWKYLGTDVKEISATTQTDANLILYRMADVMLMKAEALIWKGETQGFQTALGIINQIRKRANLEDLVVNMQETSQEQMLQLLLNERDMEFAAEGKRWYDLVRFGRSLDYKYKEQFISLVVENNETTSDSWIISVLKNNDAWFLPIHKDEIEYNRLLVQNPYYGIISE